MPSKKILLKNGKKIHVPSMFLNPWSRNDGKAIWKAYFQYGKVKGHDGIDQIDGLVIFLKDWKTISRALVPIEKVPRKKALQKEQRTLPVGKNMLRDKTLILDPGLHLLLGGKNDRKRMLKTGIFPNEFKLLIDKITDSRGKERTDLIIDKMFPYFDNDLIKSLLKYQFSHGLNDFVSGGNVKQGADIIVLPSFSITSPIRLDEQIKNMKEMNEKGIKLLEGGKEFIKVKDKRNLMSIFTFKPSILKKEYFDEVEEALMIDKVDAVGIRLLDLHLDNTSQTKNILRFIKKLNDRNKIKNKKRVPIFIFNVREFGYDTYCYGADAIIMPIARDPYIRGGQPSEKIRNRKGSYYHPKDLTDDSVDDLYEKTIKMDFELPCHCKICKEKKRITNPELDEAKKWNEFRKIHFLLCKNQEVKEFRETELPIKVALKDKLKKPNVGVGILADYLDLD